MKRVKERDGRKESTSIVFSVSVSLSLNLLLKKKERCE
jgi:hypothetical protein